MVSNGRFNTVAIAGPTCSGKTTIPGLLLGQEHIPIPTVFSFDEYDLFPSGSIAMEGQLKCPTVTNWEDPALFDEAAYISDIERLHKGLPILLKTRSRESLALGETTRTVKPTSVNVVEGIFTIRDEAARAHIDLSFYVDLPEDVMIERRLAAARGGTGPWDDPEYIRTTMVEGTRQFVVPQREHATVVLDGRQPVQELANIVGAHIFELALLP